MSSEAPLPEETNPPKSPKKRRRWIRWILVLFCLLTLLACLLFWANGRGIRWAVEKVLTQQFEGQQLTGSFQVEGTARDGLTIHNLSLTGQSKIQRVQSDLIKIDWTPASLLKKKIDSLTIEKLHLVIDPLAPDRPKTEDKKDDKEEVPLAETLNLVRGLLKPTEISITDLDFTVKNTANLTIDSFTHAADSDDYLITNLNTVDHLDRPVHNPSSTITWTEDSLALDRFTILPKLSLQNLIFQPDQMATTEIIIDGNQLTFTTDFAEAHQLTLDSPTLPIASIIEIIQPGIPAGGVITALEIDTSRGILDFQGHDLKWEDQEVPSASIEARTPDLLSPFDQPINLKIALGDQLEASGMVTINQEPLDSTAHLIFTLRDPRIPTVTGELAYTDREAHVTATALDGLHLDARYLIDSKTYQAKANAKLKDASILHENLTGPLSFTLSGKGEIEQNTHSGTLNLTSLKLKHPDLPDAVTEGNITYDWPKKVAVKGLKMTSKEGQIRANLNWENDLLTISQLDLIEGTTKLLSATAQLPAPLETQSLDDILNSTEPISLTIKSQPLSFAKLSSFAPIPADLSGIVQADLTLSGSLAQPTLNGFATLDTFRIATEPDLPPLDLELTFKTREQKLLFTTILSEPRGLLLNLDGTLPFLPRVWLESETNPDDIPVDLHIHSPSLDLARFTKSPAFPEQLSGTLKTDLTFTGSLAQPSLHGFLSLADFRLATQPDLPPLDLNLKLKTENQNLLLTANASEPGGPLLLVDGALPLLPRAWIDRQTTPNDTPIRLRAYTPEIDLKRAKPFAPIIEKITGSVKLDFLMSGTISAPQYSGSATARIPEMRIADSPISTFRDTNLNATFLGTTLTIEQSQTEASGGTAILSGTIDFAGADPIFDINLDGRHLLLHRTPDYTFRGHSDLNLGGPFSKAILSGSLQITESLIYKNVEILPFGVTTTTDIPRPNLPTFSKKREKKPAPTTETDIMACRLNIDVTTLDPVLIRGNLARGEFSGNIKVTGTIGDPKTSGTLTTKDLSADLPFSDLKIQTGIITLRPEALTNPTINLRGSSVVGKYTVQVYLTGPVENPTLILTSDPPLPESEILILIATGSASSELEDRQVASQKALQFLLEGLRRRNRGRDKTLLQRFLKNSDEIELSLGDTNQFSGRKFSSASLELGDQWDFTTQIDELGQTRALIVFSVRLR